MWLAAAELKRGALFRRVIGRGAVTTDQNGRGRIGKRLSVDAIAQVFKRVAEWIQLSDEEVAQASGHSIRVGATQDLLALNIDLASVMQAGRWKSTRMPMRYGEHVMAARGGMARGRTGAGEGFQIVTSVAQGQLMNRRDKLVERLTRLTRGIKMKRALTAAEPVPHLNFW